LKYYQIYQEKGEMIMGLTKERRGEIALALLQDRIANEGLKLSPKNTKRDIGNLSKDTGIPFDEMMEFAEWISRETLEKTFKKK
jgi:hypothetical protein